MPATQINPQTVASWIQLISLGVSVAEPLSRTIRAYMIEKAGLTDAEINAIEQAVINDATRRLAERQAMASTDLPVTGV